jgi:predicted aspartyl protease
MRTIDVPFRLVGGAQPLAVVAVHVNESGPFAFALDTGACRPVLAPELARQLDLRLDGADEAAGAGGRVTVRHARVRHFAVGAASQHNVPVVVTGEVERICAAVGARLDGVIGYEFLRHFRLTVDYRRLTLTLTDGPCGDQPRTSPLAEVPLRLAHPSKPLIVVPVTVGGSGPHPFVLDTGASACVIAGSLAAQLGIRSEVARAMTGGGGTIASGAANVSSLAVEGARVSNVTVAVADFLGALSQAVGTELLGIVGYNYLREFLVTIDYPGGTLRLE